MTDSDRAIEAQATLHHAYFLGLQLMVATSAGARTTGEWIYRLFRQQHEQYFLQSFAKLGLSGLPDAVACARYHVLSNSVGGVPVEYAEESSTKAWVRFRYPRWMFAGSTLCGIPVESSMGFLRGWYAHNGVSLNNPRLGFVCVSEDMTGEFGFCGYFKEFDHALGEEERLQFARDERPPAYDASIQPSLPAAGWDDARIARANRNYAVAYIKNGLSALIAVMGREEAMKLACRAARLTGLQYFPQLAERLAMPDGDYRDTARFLQLMFEGMGDVAEMHIDETNDRATISHSQLRIAAGVDSELREDITTCWIELWLGTIHSHRRFKEVEVRTTPEGLAWTLADRADRPASA
jgi:hypothetical protein